MHDSVELTERPVAEEIYMIAGWKQWADAGSISSELPRYLIRQTQARKIGRIRSDGFYLYQTPFTQHYFRPEIKLVEGYPQELRHRKNEVYYTGNEQKGLVIFIGDEPNMDVERYAEAFFDIARELKVKRIAALGGVHAIVPYDKDRQVTCSYSMRYMKEELSHYAVRFSNYEGGVSIGSYMAERAGHFGAEYFGFYAFVPIYDLSQLSEQLQGISIENDYKAWYDIMRRINDMFKINLDLSDLSRQSEKLIESMDDKFKDLARKMPHIHVHDFLKKLSDDFTEVSYMPLDDVWERELGDILKDLD